MPTFLITNRTIGGLKEYLHGLPDSTPLNIDGLGDSWLITPDASGVVMAPAEAPVAAEPVAEPVADAPKRRRGVAREE